MTTLPPHHPDATDVDVLADWLASARATLGKVDTKVGILLAVAVTALIAELAAGGQTPAIVHGTSAPYAWATLTVTGASVVALVVAILPQLDGVHGIALWASLNPQSLCDATTRAAGDDRLPMLELLWTARAAQRRHRLVLAGGVLLVAAVVGVLLTAVVRAYG